MEKCLCELPDESEHLTYMSRRHCRELSGSLYVTTAILWLIEAKKWICGSQLRVIQTKLSTTHVLNDEWCICRLKKLGLRFLNNATTLKGGASLGKYFLCLLEIAWVPSIVTVRQIGSLSNHPLQKHLYKISLTALLNEIGNISVSLFDIGVP